MFFFLLKIEYHNGLIYRTAKIIGTDLYSAREMSEQQYSEQLHYPEVLQYAGRAVRGVWGVWVGGGGGMIIFPHVFCVHCMYSL